MGKLKKVTDLRLEHLAESSKDPQVLDDLARSEFRRVRLKVAQNEYKSEATKALLRKDTDAEVRKWAGDGNDALRKRRQADDGLVESLRNAGERIAKRDMLDAIKRRRSVE